jgi:hypothetical protein
MPGAYTHLTMAVLQSSPNELATLEGLSKQELGPLMLHNKFFELGAVSPDYPYLGVGAALGIGTSKDWADAMHLAHTGDRLKAGIQLIRGMSGPEKHKALAWLLGFASHIVMDVTFHPVVELKVGPYEENGSAHRICEMHQDVFIYNELKVGAISQGNFLQGGIAACSDPNNSDRLDPTICKVWEHMLKTADSKLYASKAPDFHAWHKQFKGLLKLAAPGKLLAFSRHMAIAESLIYPTAPDNSYIQALRTPGGGTMSYLEIFRKAQAHCREYWGVIARACLQGEESGLSRIRNWSLDSGKDEAGTLAFWS